MEFLTIPDTYYENLRARLKDAAITVTEDLDVVSSLLPHKTKLTPFR